MITDEEKAKFDDFLKALAANEQLNYCTNNMIVLAALSNLLREAQLRLSPEKAERASKISEKIADALPQDLCFEEIALVFGEILLAQMMHQFNQEAAVIQRVIKDEELKQTGTMYG